MVEPTPWPTTPPAGVPRAIDLVAEALHDAFKGDTDVDLDMLAADVVDAITGPALTVELRWYDGDWTDDGGYVVFGRTLGEEDEHGDVAGTGEGGHRGVRDGRVLGADGGARDPAPVDAPTDQPVSDESSAGVPPMTECPNCGENHDRAEHRRLEDAGAFYPGYLRGVIRDALDGIVGTEHEDADVGLAADHVEALRAALTGRYETSAGGASTREGEDDRREPPGPRGLAEVVTPPAEYPDGMSTRDVIVEYLTAGRLVLREDAELLIDQAVRESSAGGSGSAFPDFPPATGASGAAPSGESSTGEAT